MDTVQVVVAFDWWSVIGGTLVPVAAILVSTLIAVNLAKNEREAAEQARHDDAVRASAERVLIALAPLITIDPAVEPWSDLFSVMRARTVVFRTLMLSPDEAIVGEWLSLEATHGTALFGAAVERVQREELHNYIDPKPLHEAFEAPHKWAWDTTETLADWLVGKIDAEALKTRSADILRTWAGARNGV